VLVLPKHVSHLSSSFCPSLGTLKCLYLVPIPIRIPSANVLRNQFKNTCTKGDLVDLYLLLNVQVKRPGTLLTDDRRNPNFLLQVLRKDGNG
jgi:hypothetical protein